MIDRLTTFLELVAVALVVFGAWLMHDGLALIVTGFILGGLAYGVSRKPTDQ